MKIKKFLPLLAIAVLLPSVATASVIISNTYTVTTSGHAPGVYLTDGPNYVSANAYKYIYAPVSSGNPKNITSGSTIMVNYTYGSGTDYLLNVLEVNDNDVSGVMYLNGSLPSGISIYISNNSEAYLKGSANSPSLTVTNSTGPMTAYSFGSPINLVSGHTYYISFVIDASSFASGSTGSSSIAINYYYE
ncbi:hypothetical protein [Thermoplasma volcanium]|nr:hypothetical protein [Thermoplasma volcanium]